MTDAMKESIKSTAMDQGPVDIGLCSGARIGCVSELGWFDNDKIIMDVMAAGGMDANQWGLPWTDGNAAGACNLVEVQYADGKVRRFLMDCGWDSGFIAKRLAETGVDEMIADGTVEFLYMSHEHMDHFFGLEAVLKLRPDLPVILPNTFSDQAKAFLAGGEAPSGKAKNSVPHTGELIELESDMVHILMPGVASVTFDMPNILDTSGEQSVYMNMQEKGMLGVSGCCHQGVQQFLDTPAKAFAGGDKIYGVYGGMHIVPFGDMTEEQAQMVDFMASKNMSKVACNHCTGLQAIEKMIEKGLPVVSGSGAAGSLSDKYLGNGDWVSF